MSGREEGGDREAKGLMQGMIRETHRRTDREVRVREIRKVEGRGWMLKGTERAVRERKEGTRGVRRG